MVPLTCEPTWAGACDAMANRRVTVQDGEISSGRDNWHDPPVGVIDTSIAISTDLQPSSPSMCS